MIKGYKGGNDQNLSAEKAERIYDSNTIRVLWTITEKNIVKAGEAINDLKGTVDGGKETLKDVKNINKKE